uniref:Uncharacterized protein n=1 Tax=Tetraselmis sp. GSL018 TaxID=582737 RepID=A0A061S537_9CHLO|mmetsp:Transcript_37374/g.88834  ORF Transcript_37374/g.88834 Transcript_37374/m.88834 type:complete len:221 (+) Transcript_37374:175-837(+)
MRGEGDTCPIAGAERPPPAALSVAICRLGGRDGAARREGSGRSASSGPLPLGVRNKMRGMGPPRGRALLCALTLPPPISLWRVRPSEGSSSRASPSGDAVGAQPVQPRPRRRGHRGGGDVRALRGADAVEPILPRGHEVPPDVLDGDAPDSLLRVPDRAGRGVVVLPDEAAPGAAQVGAVHSLRGAAGPGALRQRRRLLATRHALHAGPREDQLLRRRRG